MKRVEAPSYPVSIFICGDAEDIAGECQDYADQVGYCVTITPTSYIFRGGDEDGFIIGLINYPRFPASPERIWQHAETLAARLCAKAGQKSYTIQAPDKTVWISHREQDDDRLNIQVSV